MKYDGRISCPDCGSENAVSKVVAWDAAAQVPKGIADRLDILENINSVCETIISDYRSGGISNSRDMAIMLNKLAIELDKLK